MTEEREERFRSVVRSRQPNLTVILENVHDPHNIGAVLRSCDSVGVAEIYVLYSDKKLKRDRLELGQRSSSGARKWVDVHFFTDTEACFAEIRKKYSLILGTRLDQYAKDLHQLDLTASIALLFGNENSGVSEEAQRHADGNFCIPQVGMVRSLNISVACAVTLYEAFRQRRQMGFYGENPLLSKAEQSALLTEYQRRHQLKIKNKYAENRSLPNPEKES